MGIAKAVSALCRGCGARRGHDHCQPNSMGVKATNPNHPSNNGEWTEVYESLYKMPYMKNRDPEKKF